MTSKDAGPKGRLKRKYTSNMKKVISSLKRYTGYTLVHHVQLQKIGE